MRATANGQSATGGVTVTVPNVADSAGPGRVTTITATAIHYDTISLTWAAPGGGATVTGYRILRRVVDSACSFHTRSQNTGNANTTWTDRKRCRRRTSRQARRAEH